MCLASHLFSHHPSLSLSDPQTLSSPLLLLPLFVFSFSSSSSSLPLLFLFLSPKADDYEQMAVLQRKLFEREAEAEALKLQEAAKEAEVSKAHGHGLKERVGREG